MKTLPKQALLCVLALLQFSCTRDSELILRPLDGDISEYVILKGHHESVNNGYQPVSCSNLFFSVRFDSSAIYKTTDPVNQEDINKLYGFSDNGDFHHEYSARFGWNWARDSLRLYAYVYNSGSRISQELATITIGEDYYCEIGVKGNQYAFHACNNTVYLPRESQGETAKGYLLYPYFGGDETAPHDITILIRR